PHMSRMINDGSAYMLSHFFTELPEGTAISINAVKREWAQKNPREVKALQAAMADAEAFVKANDAESRGIVGREMKLAPAVAAASVIPKVVAEISSSDLGWWVDTMNEQELLRTKLDPAKLIVK